MRFWVSIFLKDQHDYFMTRLLIVFILIVSGAFCLSGQFDKPLEKLPAGNYKYGDRVGKMHQLEDVFKHDSIAHAHFRKFKGALNAQRTVNVVSSGLFGVSLGVGIGAFTSNGDNLGAVIALVYGGGLSALIAIFGNAASGSKKAKYKRMLIEYVNNSGARQHANSLIGARSDQIFVTNPFPQSLNFYSKGHTWELNDTKANNLNALINDIALDDVSRSLYLDYDYSNKRGKKARNYACVFGGASAASVIVNRTIVDQDTRKDSGHVFITQIVPILATLVSVGQANRNSKKEKRARKQFLNYINGFPTDISFEENKKINLGLSNNGVGLVLSF